jgi:fatty acid desaturase
VTATTTYRAELSELAEVSLGLAAYNVGYLALALALAFGSIALFAAVPRWYTFILAFLVVSSRQQALLNCEHECIHGKWMHSESLNRAFGYLCAGLAGSPFGASGQRHLTHHRLLGSDEDPDHELHSSHGKDTRTSFVRYFLNGFVGGYAAMVLFGPPPKTSTSTTRSRLLDLASIATCQLALLIFGTLAFGWWAYPLLWVLPLVTVTVLMHLVRSFAEHAITPDEVDEHGNRLITIRSNFFERAMLAPYNMNYHSEHHLLPGIPAPRLRAVHHRLQGRDDLPPRLMRSSYGAAMRRYVKQLPR